MSTAKKGIYCIEGLWNHNDIRDKSTVLPILDLLDKSGYCDYIYHDCATREELEFLLKRWTPKNISDKFPILYLAFHGEEENILLNNKDSYSMDELAELLEGKCYGKVIHFGSCSTLRMHGKKIQTFLKRTKAIATIGYKTDIEWLLSAACDLLVFEALQQDKLDNKGINKIQDKVFKEYGNLHKLLELRMVVSNSNYVRRKRK